MIIINGSTFLVPDITILTPIDLAVVVKRENVLDILLDYCIGTFLIYLTKYNLYRINDVLLRNRFQLYVNPFLRFSCSKDTRV